MCYRDLTEVMSTELKLIIFVMLEHFLLLVAWLIHKAIPDRPSSVRIALARADYESKLALKREVLNHLFLMLEIGFLFAWKGWEIWSNRKKRKISRLTRKHISAANLTNNRGNISWAILWSCHWLTRCSTQNFLPVVLRKNKQIKLPTDITISLTNRSHMYHLFRSERPHVSA